MDNDELKTLGVCAFLLGLVIWAAFNLGIVYAHHGGEPVPIGETLRKVMP